MRPTHSKSAARDQSRRLGVTLVEVLVCFAILGILLAVLLPAVAQSRRAAETIMCRTRMSQIGRAVHNFESRTRRYPDVVGNLDWQYEVLPDLEQSELFRILQGHEEETIDRFEFINTHAVPVFQCPSDNKFPTWTWAINYLRNGGTSFEDFETPEEGNGMTWGARSSKDVTDGLSMTAHVSEQMNAFRFHSTDRRAKWRTPTAYVQANQLDLFADLCEKMPTGALGLPDDEPFPLSFIGGYMRYDHKVRPNRATCRNANWDSRYFAFTANSLHSGGVHVLMADGAVRFVNDNVSRVVWRGMGTRNGHETITLP